MKIADYGDGDAALAEALGYMRDGLRRLASIDRYSHKLAAGARQLLYLQRGGIHVDRIRVCHRLNDDRVTAADRNAADIYCYRPPSIHIRHANAPSMI
jgi:hypothetical protein